MRDASSPFMEFLLWDMVRNKGGKLQKPEEDELIKAIIKEDFFFNKKFKTEPADSK